MRANEYMHLAVFALINTRRGGRVHGDLARAFVQDSNPRQNDTHADEHPACDRFTEECDPQNAGKCGDQIGHDGRGCGAKAFDVVEREQVGQEGAAQPNPEQHQPTGCGYRLDVQPGDGECDGQHDQHGDEHAHRADLDGIQIAHEAARVYIRAAAGDLRDEDEQVAQRVGRLHVWQTAFAEHS